MEKTSLFKINGKFAIANKLPVYFAGVKLKESHRAIYVYGKGTTQTKASGVCCICGRTLTHPVSVELGIGPECGSHYWDWDKVGGYTKENIARLTKLAQENITINQWVPKSIVINETDSEEDVIVPESILQELSIKKETASNPVKKASLVKYQNSGEFAIKMEFPYSPEAVDQVKSIPGRRFHSEGNGSKYWTIPYSVENLEKIVILKFTIDEKLQTYLDKSKVKNKDIQPVVITGLKNKLFDFQKMGVSFIEQKGGRALIADEMGLGKTVQALAWLGLHPNIKPVIVVCPASLKLNWKKEAVKWMEKPNIQILSGSSPTPIIGDIIIINYDILSSWKDALLSIKPQVLILDECHYFKNNSAQRTKAVKAIGKHIPHVIALSGTPIVNRPVEAYNAIKLIDPYFMPFWEYGRRFCAGHHNGYGWDYNGASNTKDLHQILTSGIMLRRLKKDVLSELPDKTRNFIPMELNNWKQYKYAESNFMAYLRETKGNAAAIKASMAQTLVEIENLKQLAVEGKMDAAISWIQDFVDVDGKLVIFAHHKTVIDKLWNIFGHIAVKIDGSVGNEARQAAVDKFQNDIQVRVFIGNIKAAGVGITLTAASNIVILELPWTPGELVQAEDRCHRIGQKAAVNIHYLLAENTIEEKIAALIDAKTKVLTNVLDGTDAVDDDLIKKLMESYYDEN